MLLAVLGVTVASLILYPVDPFLGTGDAAKLYLPMVAVIASAGGPEAGVLAAVLSVFVGDYLYMPPDQRIFQGDHREMTSLVMFTLIGLFMGLQTGQAREREAEARARRKEIELLDRLSSHLARDSASASVVGGLLEELVETVGASTASLFDVSADGELRVHSVAGEPAPSLAAEASEGARKAIQERRPVGLPTTSADDDGAPETFHSPEGPDVFIPLFGSDRLIGLLFVSQRRNGMPYQRDDARLLSSISHLAAVSLERHRLEEVVAQAETAREADRMKSIVVSSVSHELKTPLASITARVTNMLESDVDWTSATLQAELACVNDDLVRLNNSITDLLDLSRLEGGVWQPHLDWHDLGEILGTVMSRVSSRDRTRVQFDLPENLPPMRVDYGQLARALQHLVENALQYSPPERPIVVGGRHEDEMMTIWVEDQGPGVAPVERERVFEKFYRGQAGAATPVGTGLGLALTSEIARFHGGQITVEDASPKGARFVLTLPCPAPAPKEGIG